MKFLPAFFILLTQTAGFGQQVSLALSSGSVQPGATISLSINLSLSGGIQPASVQWTMNYDTHDFASLQVSASPATTAAGKSIQCSPTPGSATCLLFGLNTNPLPSGVLAIATLQVSTVPSHPTSAIGLTSVVAASPQAGAIPAIGNGGSVSILQALAPVIYPTGVVNAASISPQPLAPGEIISLFGSGIGPPTGTSATLTPDGQISNLVGGTKVLFDGVPAPILFARSDQVNVVVPFETSGQSATYVRVEYRGAQSDAVLLPVADASAGMFTADASGHGSGLIVNEDGSLNSPASPASPGSLITVYATGLGQTNPAGVTGQVAGDVFSRPLLPVRVFVGGLEAGVLYAGTASGFTNGVLQVNTRLPDAVGPGVVPIWFTIGSNASQAGVTCVTGLSAINTNRL